MTTFCDLVDVERARASMWLEDGTTTRIGMWEIALAGPDSIKYRGRIDLPNPRSESISEAALKAKVRVTIEAQGAVLG